MLFDGVHYPDGREACYLGDATDGLAVEVKEEDSVGFKEVCSAAAQAWLAKNCAPQILEVVHTV